MPVTFKFDWRGREASRAVKKDLFHSLEFWRLETESEAKESLRGPSPSKAGDPPGLDKGRLIGSVISAARQFAAGMVAIVGSSIAPRPDQAFSVPHYLEFGTRRMAPRPWLRPAVDKTIPKWRNRVRNIR